MNDFIRARSSEQKEFRMSEIKNAADMLFKKHPFSDITLTTIAENLGWSRANLYKYVTNKEEIFLAIVEEKMEIYFSSLYAAFPEKNNFSPEVIAEVWAGILNANQEYLRYVSILTSIIEKNVTVKRLVAFKKKYYDFEISFCIRLSEMLKISEKTSAKLFLDILFYASASASSCEKNPLIQQALEKINIKTEKSDFSAKLKDFILMEIMWNTKQQKD